MNEWLSQYTVEIAAAATIALVGFIWTKGQDADGLADYPSIKDVNKKRKRKRPGSSAEVILAVNSMFKKKKRDDDDFQVNVGIR